MTNKYCDSPIHKVSSLALAFIILAFCVLPSFARADTIRPNEPIGWKDGDTIADIVSVVLDSWGISFSGNGSGSLRDNTQSLLNEFYASQGVLASEFWATAQLGVNKLGQLILDYTTVGHIIQFAQWLINKYSLTNNSSIGINTVVPSQAVQIPYNSSTTPSSVVQRGKIAYVTYDGINYYPWYVTTTYTTSPLYMAIISSTGKLEDGGLIFYSLAPASAPVRVFAMVFDGVYDSWSQNNTLNKTFGVFKYRYTHFSGNPNDYVSYGGISAQFPVFRTEQDFLNWLSGASSSLVITTTSISVPSVTPSDGLLVTVPEAQWGDSLFDILGLIERLIVLYDNTQLEIISIVDTLESLLDGLQTTVSVDNIPGGVILDYDEYDIPLEDEWGLFDIFYNTGGDDITLLRPWQELKSIIYGFPAPILSFFALVVLFIVAYGFIRMGRDSH